MLRTAQLVRPALPLADNHLNVDDILTGKTMAVQFSNVQTDKWDITLPPARWAGGEGEHPDDADW